MVPLPGIEPRTPSLRIIFDDRVRRLDSVAPGGAE